MILLLAWRPRVHSIRTMLMKQLHKLSEGMVTPKGFTYHVNQGQPLASNSYRHMTVAKPITNY